MGGIRLMSTSWKVMESVALAPSVVVETAGRYLERLTGHGPWVLTATGYVDGEQWSWPTDVSSAYRSPTLRFDFELTAELEDLSGTAVVDSDQEIEDDGSPVPGRAFVEVIAARDQVSAVVSLSVALGIFQLSGGDFSGTGFDTWYERSDLPQVLNLFPPVDGDGSRALGESISRVARVLRLDSPPLQGRPMDR